MPRKERPIEEEVSEKVAYKCEWQQRGKHQNFKPSRIQIQTKEFPKDRRQKKAKKHTRSIHEFLRTKATPYGLYQYPRETEETHPKAHYETENRNHGASTTFLSTATNHHGK